MSAWWHSAPNAWALCAILSLTSLLSACMGTQKEGLDLVPAANAAFEPEGQPTLADFWDGRATFAVDVPDTGLPMGESDTVVRDDGILWSYVHASGRSAGAVDQCGAPVPFPGCTVIYRSGDGGRTFTLDSPPVCQFECLQCPCDSQVDHVDQQQYPRVQEMGQGWLLAYEFRGRIMLRRSADGLQWSRPERIADTGPRDQWSLLCPAEERIGDHPFATRPYNCLAGGPPGLFVEGNQVYVFAAVGQSPGGIGCLEAALGEPGSTFERCKSNPLIRGASSYGPLDAIGRPANAHFDFRMTSSVEVIQVGEEERARYYMLYEGIRGPAAGDAGDSQFGLGMARSVASEIDGPWEAFPNNPLLVDLPGNIGLGHADLVLFEGKTYLYTSLDGVRRGRLSLIWK